jgi:hypothetical protein
MFARFLNISNLKARILTAAINGVKTLLNSAKKMTVIETWRTKTKKSQYRLDFS